MALGDEPGPAEARCGTNVRCLLVGQLVGMCLILVSVDYSVLAELLLVALGDEPGPAEARYDECQMWILTMRD